MGLFPSKLFPSQSKNGEWKDETIVGSKKLKRGRGRRKPENDLFLSEYSFVHQKVCKDYLRCEIQPWAKTDRSGSDGLVSLEILRTDFLDRDYPGPGGRRRFRQYFQMSGEKYRRVVGFRELLMKREYAQYLKDLKKEEFLGIKGFPITRRYWRLARGGGPKKAGTTGGAGGPKKAGTTEGAGGPKKAAQTTRGGKKDDKKADSTSKKGNEQARKEGGGGSASKKPPDTTKKGKQSQSTSGGLGCFGKLFQGDSDLLTKKQAREKAKRNTELLLKHQVVKKWKWPNKRKRLPVPTEEAGKYVVLQHRLYRMPKENEERDSEWLYLSTSTEDNDPDVVSHFDKDLHRWMTPGISFESQKLFRQLALYWSLVTLSGRSFLHHRHNYFRGHVEFSCRKRQMITFFLTTILLWTILCMSICSIIDINADLNVHHLQDSFLLVEKLELRKYWLLYVVIIGNLILVTFWSLAVILGDGNLIAHYMNCWCAALHEMETSGALDIRKLTFRNIQIYALLATAYTLMFLANWPKPVRGSCLLTSMLLFRPSIPLLRISHNRKLLLFQWIGFGIQLYVLFCARLVMCFLQIFALMLKNVSEMWNFKYSLRFRLLAQENRGELVQLQLKHSLIKLWSHHRLIVLLLEQYGLVFSIGIMCYIIPQLCIFAVALANLILNDDAYERKFYGLDDEVKIYSDHEATITIPYYHSALENNFIAAVIFLHISLDLFFTTDTLTSATDAFLTGAEFVRRTGMMSAPKSHERHLIHSLQWSFSPSRVHGLTANRYFVLNRHNLTKIFSVAVLIFTILIRVYTPNPPFKITFPPTGSCRASLGQTLIRGICTINEEIEVTTIPPPPPPPAIYYFFLEHCEYIEKNFQSKVKTFGYYSENSEFANQPPFQICQVEIQDGTRLPSELADLGRYFQDHGNPGLNETLKIYFNQTHNYQTLNYDVMNAATAGFHSDSTGGAYCGPDAKGQIGQSCEWVEYYRDCVVVCYSKFLDKVQLLPKMWKKSASGVYALYSDYHQVDCGVNPFGWRIQGDSFSTRDPAYDCFGNLVELTNFDLCSNIPWKLPRAPFLSIRGDKTIIHRSYSSDWYQTPKNVTATASSPPPVCDQCYDYDVPRTRCANAALVRDHCPYARYWGKQSPTKGYYLAENCWELGLHLLDAPKPTGFCQWNYVEGGVLAGHVVSQTTYAAARAMHWNKEWNISKEGEMPPCHNLTDFRPIEKQLYFKHVCLSEGPASGNCDGKAPQSATFHANRPYELVGCSNLRQIKLNYEQPKGNQQLCNFTDKSMIIPVLTPITITVNNKAQKYLSFYGCHGKPLLSTKNKNYHCIGPEGGGVCEVDAAQGFLLFEDCSDPEISKSSSAVLGDKQGILQLPLKFGLCSAIIDYSSPTFANFRIKLLSENLVSMLNGTEEWNVVNVWNVPQKILTKHPGSPSLPGKSPYCDKQLTTHYCGSNSVALHYPYDGQSSVLRKDKFLCNWETYYRDCMQPFPSKLVDGWVYLPKSMEPNPLKLSKNLRKNYALLNPFWWKQDLLSCDGRRLPALSSSSPKVDNYWTDDCGWNMSPEFVDGDLKSLALMPPILPISREFYVDNGTRIETRTLHCFDSKYAIYRCTHADIFPICKSNLSVWEPTHGVLDTCYRFNTTCYEALNKQPNGSVAETNVLLTYPNGFCRGYCPQLDLDNGLAISENLMNVWRDIENLNFDDPPCVDYTGSAIPYLNTSAPIEIEHHLFFEFHCGNPSKNGQLRDPASEVTSTFHWPMYQDENDLKYRFIPLRALVDHLTTAFGPACDYKGRGNENNIYPQFVNFPHPDDPAKIVRIEREDFLGCHGYSLVWFLEEFRQNLEEMASIGVTDPFQDYRKVCFGELLGGWCEATVEPLVFLRDDFEVTCKPGKEDLLPAECPSECSDMQGHFANTSLAKQVRDIPGYSPFVRSQKKFVLARSEGGGGTLPDHNLNRTDLPYRRLFLSEFKDITKFWGLYKNFYRQRQYLLEHTRVQTLPPHRRCFHGGNIAMIRQHCTWPMFLKWCMVPCNLVSNPSIITEVSQSLVEKTPGQADMYLRPVVYYANLTNKKLEPLLGFVDCIIDPMTAGAREFSDKGQLWHEDIHTCGGLRIDDASYVDNWKYAKFPEFLPDYTRSELDATTGFIWVPWRIQFPTMVEFKYKRLQNYADPKTYSAANPPTFNYTEFLYASPYLACHRMTQEPMRNAVMTAVNMYWNKTFGNNNFVTFRWQYYRFYPNSSESEIQYRTCRDTAVSIYMDHRACKLYQVPSRVIRLYGFCRVILPTRVAFSGFSALAENASGIVPIGCITNASHPKVFNEYFSSKTLDKSRPTPGYFGLAIPFSVPDVYKQWNSLCHACAYTREQHVENAKSAWCGRKKDQNPTCLTHIESVIHNRPPVTVGEGPFYKSWVWAATHIGVLWHFATQYACWRGNDWVRHARWTTYHPWSQVHEKNVAAYNIHVPMNALNCPFPCKGPDESQDCNSNCPFESHNPCDRNISEFYNYDNDIGLKYTVILREEGKLCQVSLAGLNEKLQGLQVFGEFGINMVYTTQRKPSRWDRGIFIASSEVVNLDDREGVFGSYPYGSKIWYSYVWENPKTPVYHQGVIPFGIEGIYEAPRFAAVHPGWYGPGSNKLPMYSSYCAGFEGDTCEVTKLDWDPKKRPPQLDLSLLQNFIKFPVLPPGFYLTVRYSPGCTTQDKQFVRYIYYQDPQMQNAKIYCCIPFQEHRRAHNISATDFEKRYFLSVRGTWDSCQDSVNPVTNKSRFGWFFPWNKWARYLSACPFTDCQTNKCQNQLRNRTFNSDTDLCTRQFDPQEQFLGKKIPRCKLPLSPY